MVGQSEKNWWLAVGIGSVATILTLTRAVSVGAKPASNGFRKEAEGWQEEVTSDNIREAFAKKRSKKGAWLGGPVAPWLGGRGGAGECQGVQELAWPPHQGPTLLCGESGAQP